MRQERGGLGARAEDDKRDYPEPDHEQEGTHRAEEDPRRREASARGPSTGPADIPVGEGTEDDRREPEGQPDPADRARDAEDPERQRRSRLGLPRTAPTPLWARIRGNVRTVAGGTVRTAGCTAIAAIVTRGPAGRRW